MSLAAVAAVFADSAVLRARKTENGDAKYRKREKQRERERERERERDRA